MSQQLLYGSKVCPLFQQVRGKRVPEHMYVYPVLDAGTVSGLFQYFYQCARRILLAGSIALEQPFLWTVFPEIIPQLVQHLFRQ